MNKEEKDLIVAIVGPSGCGKSHLSEMLLEKDIKGIESYTTRLPRYRGEKGHTFVGRNQFVFEEGEVYRIKPYDDPTIKGFNTEKVDAIAYTLFDGEHYWAEREQYEGKGIVSYVVDPAGAIMLRETVPRENLLIVYIANVPEKTLYDRMAYERGIKHAEERISHDKEMFQFCPADVVIDGRLPDKVMYRYILTSIRKKGDGLL